MNREAWSKFKALSFEKKLEYIWDYFRWPIIITVMVLSIAISWIHSAVTAKDPVFYITMINTYGNSPDGKILQPLLEAHGYEYFDGAVIIDKKIQLGGPDGAANAASNQILMCSVAVGEPDLIFWDHPNLEPVLGHGTLMNLQDVFSPEFLEAHKDNLIYNDDPEDPYPCGIYLEENEWMMDNLYYVNCSFGIPYGATDLELVKDFILTIAN